MALLLEKEEREGSVVLAMEGEVDVATSHLLRDELNDIVESGHRRIIIDMTRVTYMDSSGLGALVQVHRILGNKGSLALVGCRPAVERVLRFTQFDKVLDLYRTFEDLEAGNRDNLRAVSGISKSVIMKQKSIPKPAAPRSQGPGRRLQ